MNGNIDKRVIAMIKPGTKRSVLHAKEGNLLEAGKFSDAKLGKAYAANTKKYSRVLGKRY